MRDAVLLKVQVNYYIILYYIILYYIILYYIILYYIIFTVISKKCNAFIVRVWHPKQD